MAKKIIKKKVKKALKKIKKADIQKARVKRLQDRLHEKINKFNVKHQVYKFCYPNGIKMSKGAVISTCYKQHIYVCHTLCKDQCDSFKRKSFICKDIGCSKFRFCELEPFKEMIKHCKKEKLYKERLRLLKLYKKYFHIMAVYRGLKIDPSRTFRYLDKKKKAKEGKNGKV